MWSAAAQPAGYLNRIVLETGYTKEEIVARLHDGRADIAWSGVPQADADRLRDTHGSQMLHTTAGLNTNYVFLNATKPPFNNRDARRAVAYALDRGALTGDRNLFSGPVTCQLLPPGLAAYHPYCRSPMAVATTGSGPGPTLAPPASSSRSPEPSGPESSSWWTTPSGPADGRPAGRGPARPPRVPRVAT